MLFFILLFYFQKSEGFDLEVVPCLDTEKRGLSATGAPRRPSGIGISVVGLNGVEKNVLYIENVDILDGTPLLDIRPCVPEFNGREGVRAGWL